jgi:predicted dehydrogenase
MRHAIKEPGVTLSAVYSRTQARGQALAQRYGCSRVYTDFAGFLADPRINTVYIATPNTLHYPQAKAALEAGKHVILEKPFCTTYAHALELVELAKSKGLMLVDATPTAYLPNLAVLRQLLPRIGRVRLVMSNYSQYSSRYDQLLAGELPNNFNPQFAGGCLMDINYYNLQLNVTLFGSPKELHYYPNRFVNGIDTSGSLVMVYEDFVSQNAGAKDTWGENFVQIEGEKGYLYISGGSMALTGITLVTREGKEVRNLQDIDDRWYYEAVAVAKLLLEEDRAAVEAQQQVMLATVKALEEARLSAGIRFPGDEADV